MTQTDAGVVAGADAIRRPAPVVPGSLGVLGGTFDPIHHGHLAVAEDVRETLGLERILLVPAAHPPHKPGRPITPAAHRLAMVELAVAENPRLGVSAMEIERGGDSFTVDTLEALRSDGEGDVWFILSAEALAGFDTWRMPERILDLARLAVVPRGTPGADAAPCRRGRRLGRRALSRSRGPRPVPAGAPVAHLR